MQNLPSGRLIVTMVDAETKEENTWGTCFEIYADGGGSRGEQVLSNQCNPRGTASLTIGSLSPGSYVIAHSGFTSSWPYYYGSNTPYFLAEDVLFTIVGGEDTPLTVAVAPWPSLAISMQDEARNPLPGACFTVWWGGVGSSASACDEGDGADDGTITITKVQPGTHWLVQTTVPAGYSRAVDVLVAIPNEPVVEVTLQNLPGGAVVATRSDSTGQSLMGSCYDVYTDAGDGDHGDHFGNGCDGRYDFGWLYDADGTATIAGLLPGKYVLVETRASVWRHTGARHPVHHRGRL